MKKIELKIEMYESVTNELVPYFERFNNLKKATDEEPCTFEQYVELVLTLGCKQFMLDNAKYLENSSKAYYKQKEGEKSD